MESTGSRPAIRRLFLIDIPFFAANISKIFHGAWFPLVIGAATFVVMITYGGWSGILRNKIKGLTPKLEKFKEILARDQLQSIRVLAVFLTEIMIFAGSPDQNMKHNKILHSEVIFLTVGTEPIPRVPESRKDRGRKARSGNLPNHCTLRLHEHPNIDTIFALSRDKGLKLEMKDASFFLGPRETGD